MPTNIAPEIAAARISPSAESASAVVRRRLTTIQLIDAPGIHRDGLCALLESDTSLEVIAVTSGRRDALQALRAVQPDVVIMDFSIDPLAGRETIAQIKRRWPRIGVLVLAQPGHKDIEAAVQAGADGYVLLDENCTELFNAVRRIALGRGYISAAALDRVATSHGNKNERAPGQSLQAKLLTNREREVIALIAKGYRTREMAQLLSLSHKTVEKHRANLMRKLGLRSAAAAAVYAITHGLSEGTDTRDGSRRD